VNIREATEHLLSGWREKVEYSVSIEGRIEKRSRVRRFDGLISQLELMARMPASMASDGGCNPNKSGSKPPVNQAPLNLIDDIHEDAGKLLVSLAPHKGAVVSLNQALSLISSRCDQIAPYEPQLVTSAENRVSSWVKRARVMLGYDVRETVMAEVVCPSCGGDLSVAVDASTDLRCVGSTVKPSCGLTYPRWDWLRLLEAP